jgi:hypothetical protein
MQAITTIGLDIAKSVFQVHGIDAEGNGSPQEIQDKSEDDTDEYRRHDGKVEDEFATRTLVFDVARQKG